MKKKLLLITLLVALFACIFAVAVSAEEVGGIYYTLDNTNLTATVNTENVTKCELTDVNIPEKIKVGDIEYTVTAIAGKAFGSQNASQGNSKVVSVTVPKTVTSIGSYAFANCVNITTVKCYSPVLGSYMFSNCPWMETVILENTVTISNHAFCTTTDTAEFNNKKTNISSLVLPDTVESIGNYAFARCKITSIVIPAKVSSVGTFAFTDCDELIKAVVLGSTISGSMFSGSGKLGVLVVTPNLTSVGSSALGGTPEPIITYFVGTKEQATAFKTTGGAGNGTGRFRDASLSAFAEYTEDYKSISKSQLIYDCNLCVVAFGGNHTAEDDGDCTTAVVCSMCKAVELKAAMAEHVNGEKLTYTSLMSKGEHFVGCTNDGCKLGEATEIPALFTCLGYSTELEGYGIVCEFSINLDAVQLYISLVDSDFDYGMVVAIGNSSPLSKDENGNVAPIDKAVACSFVNTNYSRLQIKIANITEDKFSTEIVSTLYVCTNNEIGYVNDGKIEKTAIGKTYTELKK